MKSHCDLSVHLVSFIFLLMGIFLVEENCLVQGMPLPEASNYLSLCGYKGPTLHPRETIRKCHCSLRASQRKYWSSQLNFSPYSVLLPFCLLTGEFLSLPPQKHFLLCFLHIDLLGNTSVTSTDLKELF